MFQKLYFPELLFISIFILSFNQIYAQEEEGEIFIISEKVGEVIDLEERNKYNLFPAVKGFQSAVFLKLHDGNYVFKITYLDKTTGKEKFHRLPQTESSVKRYGRIIEPFEEIQMGEKPPLSVVRIAGEISAGSVLGLSIFIPIAYAIEFDGEWDDKLAGPLFAWWTFGNAIGVYLVGNIGDETGQFKASFGGSILGLVVGSVFLAVDEGLGYHTMVFCTPIGAVIGFNMTRRYKSPPASETALFNFRDGQTSFDFPKIYFRPNPFNKGDLIQTVDLVKVRF